VVSSELPEVLTLADRVLVMREGRLVATMPRAEASEEAIVAAGTGQPRQSEPAPEVST
jgi:rhamnose transport system ATP-binding protein